MTTPLCSCRRQCAAWAKVQTALRDAQEHERFLEQPTLEGHDQSWVWAERQALVEKARSVWLDHVLATAPCLKQPVELPLAA